MTFQSESPGRVTIVGTGLIGGSIGLALRARGWTVAGSDEDRDTEHRALAMGALESVGEDPGADVVFVATPVSVIVGTARRALARAPAAVVTDVGGVKGPIVAAVDNPRFVGGHPMAGSEQEGLEGADPDLFVGATWVLTPTSRTDAAAYTRLRSVISTLGADVVAVTPERHDSLVAVVSHVPHLAAATLMELAADDAHADATMLRLAAGGFRDMTRIAAGHPGIWPDICSDNADAITSALDRLLVSLTELREMVATRDRSSIVGVLERARKARRNLPSRVPRPEDMAEIRVPVPDRPGVLAEVTTLAGQLGVNIWDMEIAHSAEGGRGVLSVVIDAGFADLVSGSLSSLGYRPSVHALG